MQCNTHIWSGRLHNVCECDLAHWAYKKNAPKLAAPGKVQVCMQKVLWALTSHVAHWLTRRRGPSWLFQSRAGVLALSTTQWQYCAAYVVDSEAAQ